jgi:hypothetical protein
MNHIIELVNNRDYVNLNSYISNLVDTDLLFYLELNSQLENISQFPLETYEDVMTYIVLSIRSINSEMHNTSSNLLKNIKQEYENKYAYQYNTIFKKQFRFINQLHPELKYYLKIYSSSKSYDINEKLRYQRYDDLTDEEINCCNALNYIFDNIPPIDLDFTVYRGLFLKTNDLNISTILDMNDINLMSNQYISTTISLGVAYDFSDKLNKLNANIIEIKIKSGEKCIPLMTESISPEQLEILLPPEKEYTFQCFRQEIYLYHILNIVSLL